MTLRGGAAAKLGHRYEKWWTLSELVRMLRGDTDSLRIEEPGLDGVEFVVKVGGQREYHQAKRSHPSGKWSMAMLASSGVLASIGKLLIGHQDRRFVFVSSSDARELADLCEGAVAAESFEEFEARFLSASRRANHKKVQNEWRCDSRTAWNVFHRIDVGTISERELETKVRWGMSALFIGQVDQFCAHLTNMVDDAVHRTLERDELLNRLEEAGFLLRRVSSPHAARQAVVQATERYLQGIRRNLIQGSLIPRDKTDEIVERLTGGQPRDCVLTGQAGAGKTGCVIEVIEKLRNKGVQVLAFRLDRHMSATSTTDLGQRLELEESPALVLSAASKADEARPVLIIDQLDAVSTMSGRRAEAFEVVEQILMEAKAGSIETIVVCRAFDWNNDPRLRSLIREDDAKVELGELSPDEVRHVLAQEQLHASALSDRQLNLLRLPQNLSLFLSANITSPIAFSSVDDLLGRYWDEKRELIKGRAEGEGDRWLDVIGTMCEAMSDTQQLSVRKEKLDRFSPRYLDQFVSENVLVLDGNSYAFGHESFFDYCFARLFVTKEECLVALLKSGEQHLFRRAQVRQVLTYLREANFERYASELRALVFEGGIRTHLRDSVFAWLARVDDPHDDEWVIWFEYVEPHLVAREKGEGLSNKHVVRAWERLFYAKSWFRQFDKRLISCWLQAQINLDLATEYLRWHQDDRPDEVAAYLEPFADRGGEWGRRLRSVMFHPHACHSRRNFDLYLRLLENGTLDVDRDDGFGERFDLIYYGLRKRQPDWIPEVLGRQVHRLGASVAASHAQPVKVRWSDTLGGASIEVIQEAAKNTPASFVRRVLRPVLALAESAVKEGQRPPIRDMIWPIIMTGSSSAADACLHALAEALGKLAGDGEDLCEWIKLLLSRETHVANHLLLALYQGGGRRYADEAVLAFCRQPWRFDCGYAGSHYWCATETLKAVVPHCTPENRTKLEGTILAYLGSYEETPKGVKHRGWAAFNLLSAIADQLNGHDARRRYKELQRKFDNPATAPREFAARILGPPIARDKLERMNNVDWLGAIAAYPSEWRERSTLEDRLQGGAMELAHVFGDAARKEPERFAKLGLELPQETNPLYFSALIRGLSETDIDEDTRVAICHKAFKYKGVDCGGDIAGLLAKANTPLSENAIGMLAWLAVKAEDMEDEEQWKRETSDGQFYWGGDIYTNGINTARGQAALAIGELIQRDSGYISRLESTLNELVRVRSAAVGSCVAHALRAVAYHNTTLGIGLFLRMDFSEERLLGTHHVYEFIREHLYNGAAKFRHLIVQMLRSRQPDVSRTGARLGCMAAFLDVDAWELADESRRGHRHQRLGAADVAAANVGEPAYRDWCENALADFFVDSDAEVRKVAASCFRNISENALASFNDLVDAFSNSEAYNDDAFPLLYALKDARSPLPEMTCLACERLLEYTDSRGLDMWQVSELAFRLYQQHPNDKWTKRCLDLIDHLCLEAPSEASQALEDFER